MRGLDDTDREIFSILLEDARRPYSDIADAVDLSPPAVSDRIERLQEMGLIRRFTVDVDRSMLEEGLETLVSITARPGHGSEIYTNLADAESVEYLFRTADEEIMCTVRFPRANIRTFLDETVDLDVVDEYDVKILAESSWSPGIGDAELAPTCAECGNTVTVEGEMATLDGDLYHFCCASCYDQFVTRYEELSEAA